MMEKGSGEEGTDLKKIQGVQSVGLHNCLDEQERRVKRERVAFRV